MKNWPVIVGVFAIIGLAALALNAVGSESPAITWAVLGLALYFIPALVAFHRMHRQRVPILILNVFLGWTLLGWAGALVWAFTAQDRPLDRAS